MTTVDSSVNKVSESAEASVERTIVVTQPQKLEGLLETIDLINTVSERMGEDKSGDLGGGGSGGGTQQGDDDDDAVSARQLAIDNLPELPVMQQKLQEHIKDEIKKLRTTVKKKACKASTPGSAYQLNELYGKIRRLNNILSELLGASLDVVKRLYIRLFIDKQSVF